MVERIEYSFNDREIHILYYLLQNLEIALGDSRMGVGRAYLVGETPPVTIGEIDRGLEVLRELRELKRKVLRMAELGMGPTVPFPFDRFTFKIENYA